MEAFVATFAMTDCSVQHSNALSSSAKRREMPHTHRTAAGWLQPWLLRFACRMAWSTKQLSRVRGGRPGRTLAPVRSKDGRMDFDVDQIPVPRRAGSSKAPLPFMCTFGDAESNFRKAENQLATLTTDRQTEIGFRIREFPEFASRLVRHCCLNWGPLFWGLFSESVHSPHILELYTFSAQAQALTSFRVSSEMAEQPASASVSLSRRAEQKVTGPSIIVQRCSCGHMT